MNDYSQYLDFARFLAREARAVIMPHFHNCVAEFKPDGSEVTAADRGAEEHMRALIHASFMDHRVLGEEFGVSGPEHGRFQWILDPVDGTHWLPLGVPVFGSLIAMLDNDRPVVGVIGFPATGESVFAARGLGCWYAREGVEPVRARVQRVEKLNQAYCSSSGPHHSDIQPPTSGEQFNLGAYIRQAGRFRFISDCLQHALVCRGRIQAALDAVMKPWDSAALIPCIEEAGGIVTTASGQVNAAVFGGSLLSTCGGPLHQEIVQVLNSPVE